MSKPSLKKTVYSGKGDVYFYSFLISPLRNSVFMRRKYIYFQSHPPHEQINSYNIQLLHRALPTQHWTPLQSRTSTISSFLLQVCQQTCSLFGESPAEAISSLPEVLWWNGLKTICSSVCSSGVFSREISRNESLPLSYLEFPLLWRNTMTTATPTEKYFIWASRLQFRRVIPLSS